MMKRIVLLFLCLLLNQLASAQDIALLETVENDFRQDTAVIESEVRSMLDLDYSTMGMIQASLYSEEAYDKLLNKYYALAMTVLDDANKQRLKNSQRKWIELRDADIDLVRGIVNQCREAAEGGTIWGVIAADAQADVTRRRVVELYNYIMLCQLN